MVMAAGPAASSNSATEFAADKPLDVDARCQGIVLDELPARLNQIAHQLVEEHVGFIDLLDAHLQQRACIGVEGRFPQLLWVHFAQAFVALKRKTLSAR